MTAPPASKAPSVTDAANIARAVIRGIPYLGATLEQLIYGKADELRMRRIEATLSEVGERLQRAGTPPPTAEEYATLLERVAKPLSRAASEDRRRRFRDLLINAAKLPSGDAGWAEADLAAKLLDEIEAPGLAVLAAVARAHDVAELAMVSRPVPQLVSSGAFSWESPTQGHFPIGYAWPLVEEWTRRLREARLISFNSHDGRGGFGGLALSPLGQLLVEWVMTEQD